MANPEHLKILKQGVEAWNKWREENTKLRPDLSKADLKGADISMANLIGANLRWADLSEANLVGACFAGANLSETKLIRANLIGADFSGADLSEANLSEANLSEADLSEAYLRWADLREADLREANLREANLSEAKISGADLREADLEMANLVETKLEGTNISNSRIYGISAWNLKISQETMQINLVITQDHEPIITVDDLEVAQFVYLLLNNEKIRDVIDTITSKVVLILGRFTVERKDVLEAIRNELRKRDYLPILFDFDKPVSRDLTETISTLAHLARFIIADITDAKSIPQELQAVVPNLPSVPIQPLLLGSSTEYGMFEHFRRYPWVLEICRYHDPDKLIRSIQTKVIAPAEEKAKALMEGKNR